MKIQQSQIDFAAQHRKTETTTLQETLRAWNEQGQVEIRASGANQKRLKELAQTFVKQQEKAFDSVKFSANAQNLLPKQSFQPIGSESVRAVDGEEEDPFLGDLRMAILKAMIEHTSGRKIQLIKPADFEVPQAASQALPPQVQASVGQAGPAQQPAQGWGMRYDFYSARQETESVAMSAQGMVQTADGQKIQISVQMSMSRQFIEENQLQLRAGDALKDPLVVNYAGTAASLTERNFRFDLDSDGRMDQIAFVGPGSGFLALDRNNDGQINNGSELFGAATGQGFQELAQHDDDGNGWIDESDAIYNRLRIWTRDASGQDQLFALGEKGIGAIYLGHVQTPFDMRNAQQEQLGQLSQTGLFLKENGESGTIQQIDLVA